MNPSYSRFTLPNGLRFVCWHRPSALVSYIGVCINAGSRDETLSRQGLAHFVEHTLFKGTDKRSNWQISNRMESIGGELNAYTSKEETMVYTTSPSGYEERALELLADLVSSSRFPHEEVEREKDVVIEEIHSYQDSPSELVYDEFEELAYAGSGLAHNILGTPESVRELSGKDCRDFLDSFYTPTDMVVYCCSPLPPEKLERLAAKHFSLLHYPTSPRDRVAPPPMAPFDVVRNKEAHQANSIIGARVFNRRDPRRFSLFLLNNYLGGPGLNSRLYHELREKRGYVYAVDSSVGLLSDTGLMLIYFGCDVRNVDRCRKIINNEIDRLCQNKLTPTTLEKIKRQYCGQLLVSSDNIESRAMALAKSLLYFDEIVDITFTTQRIREVTADEMMESARLLAPERCGRLTLS